MANGGRERTTTLCATFEAVIGALYVDVGLTAVQPLLEGLVEPALQAILRDSSTKMPAVNSKRGHKPPSTQPPLQSDCHHWP
ncbi:MAG: hypothetical protein IPL28_22625 [Chloroflexi bacterium]|nr:hypothetical protein [Chloroflexota bacterium]